MKKGMFWILVMLCLTSVSVVAQEVDPGERDTVRVQSVQVDPGEQAVVQVTLFNDELLGAAVIPLSWDSPDILLDSVSYVGSRVDYVTGKQFSVDTLNQRLLIGFIVITEAYLASGDGLFATLYFNVPPGTSDQLVTIDSTFYPPAGQFSLSTSSAETIIPEYQKGEITIGNPQFPPSIGYSPSSFSFDGIVGGVNPDPQSLTITNEGGGTLEWSAMTSSGWLSVGPPSGTAPSLTSVLVNTSGLSDGIYNDTIVISDPNADNSPQKIPVELTMENPPPEISVTPTSFSVSAIAGGANPPDEILTIENAAAAGDLNWTVSNSESWLMLSPLSGSPPQDVTLQFDISSLSYGFYYDTIVVSDPNATNDPVKVPVTLQIVSDLPVLEVDPLTVYAVAEIGTDAAPEVITITNSGEGVLNFTVSETSPRIQSLLPASGTAPEMVTINFNTDGLGLGTYYDTLTVSSTEAINSPILVEVITKVEPDPPEITAFPISISFSQYECWQGPLSIAPEKKIQVINLGGGLMRWGVSHKEDWLNVDPDTGYGGGFIYLTLNDVSGYALGTYTDTVTITSNDAIGSPRYVPVMLNIVPADEPADLVVLKDTNTISAQEVFGTTRDYVAQIYNNNPGCMSYSIDENVPWLEFDEPSGQAPVEPKMGVKIGAYTYGTYLDSFLVTSPEASNSPQWKFAKLQVWRLHGDADWSNLISVVDVIYLIDFIFKGGPQPKPEFATGDTNCDLLVNVSDLIVIVDYIFKGGDAPCGNLTTIVEKDKKSEISQK